MKKILYSLSAIVLVLIGFGVFNHSKVAKALESYFTRYQIGTNSTTVVATTTVTYMTPGTATTTVSFPSQNIDKADVFVQTTASTSLSILNWIFQYSNNGIDWYDYTGQTNTSNILYTVGSTTVYSYTSGSITASTTRLVTTFPDIASNFKRVSFFVPIGSARSSIWTEVTAKSNAQ